MRSRSVDIDPATIADDVLRSERARRNALKRGSYVPTFATEAEEAEWWYTNRNLHGRQLLAASEDR